MKSFWTIHSYYSYNCTVLFILLRYLFYSHILRTYKVIIHLLGQQYIDNHATEVINRS